jgi:hypothetical protein
MTLHRLLLREQAVTPEMALRLGKLCGNGPEFLAADADATRPLAPERTLAADLARISTQGAA